MSRAVLSLGSNLDDRYRFLADAVARLDDELLVISGIYESEPWPPGDPVPWYLNAVALVATDAGPGHWLERARQLERAAGRVREPGHRHPPRTLDVDVIMVWDDDGVPVSSGDPELTLPHPRAHLRAFVLRPWLDIQPYAAIPGHGWLTDLIRTDPVAADLARLRPRPDLPLPAVGPLESGS